MLPSGVLGVLGHSEGHVRFGCFGNGHLERRTTPRSKMVQGTGWVTTVDILDWVTVS
jgi:hypothetical protein